MKMGKTQNDLEENSRTRTERNELQLEHNTEDDQEEIRMVCICYCLKHQRLERDLI
uniref:Uncharacterized protein n=1 Tax=Arion vulgaris TaxID=1028688 RepID=A0A0B7BF31_9EUPU